MHHRIMKRILFLTFIFYLLTIPVLSQSKIILNQKQAVAVAEKFVAENGYTDKRPIKKKSLFLETGEKISDIKKIIASRFDLIESWATFAVIKEVDGESVWSVLFLFIQQDYEKQMKEEQRGTIKVIQIYAYGREVRMSLDGRKVLMEKDPVALPVSLHGDCTGGI